MRGCSSVAVLLSTCRGQRWQAVSVICVAQTYGWSGLSANSSRAAFMCVVMQVWGRWGFRSWTSHDFCVDVRVCARARLFACACVHACDWETINQSLHLQGRRENAEEDGADVSCRLLLCLCSNVKLSGTFSPPCHCLACTFLAK